MVKSSIFLPSSLFRDVSDDDKLPQNSSIIAKVKRQKVILLGSDVMSSLSLDAVVTEICREMDSEEAAFAGEKTLATATFLASASRGEKSTGNYGGIFFDAIAKHENSAHLLLLKLASFGIYPLRGTYDVSLFDFCDEPAARRHLLQFRHPLMQMFSSLQPSEREISKSSTPYRSLTSISWLRSSARLGFRVRRCARLKIRFAIAC